MTAQALLFEHDDALGEWLKAVLSGLGLEVQWEKGRADAEARLSSGARYALVVAEGLSLGDDVTLAANARAQGNPTLLLLPEGRQAPDGAADRVLFHPLTKTGLVDAVNALQAPSPSADDTVETEATPADLSAAPANAEAATAAAGDAQATEALDPVMLAARAKLNDGKAALASGALDMAVMDLESALALMPDDPEAKLYATWARYVRMQQTVTEASVLRRTIDAAANAVGGADARVLQATIAADFGDHTGAIALVELAMETAPDHPGLAALTRRLEAGSTRGDG